MSTDPHRRESQRYLSRCGSKWAVTILSGNWIQLWALPALQRSQNKIQANQSAKADVDHQNITYVVDLLERVERRLRASHVSNAAP